MKIIPLFTLLVTLLATTISFGQTFKNDWVSFNAKNWVIKQGEDTASYLGKQTQGQLIFKNKINKVLTLKYYVYNKTDIDSIFAKKIQDWMFVQSCTTFTDGKINFISFDFGEYYYLLKVCHNCNTEIDQECAFLSRQIFNYILRKGK